MLNKYVASAIFCLLSFLGYLAFFFIIKEQFFAIFAVAFYAIGITIYAIFRLNITLVNLSGLTVALLINAYWLGWL